jgi:tetratricopeptide (TPR) repeat protein
MKTAIPILCALLLLAACGGSAPTDAPDRAMLEARDRIQRMEDSLMTAALDDAQSARPGNALEEARSARALIDVYKAYANAFKLDSMAPEFLFRAASVHGGLNEHDKALVLIERIVQEYPGWNRLPETLFTRAFILHQHTDRKGDARNAYEEFIARYGDHPLAPSARQLVEDLFLTDEEFLERVKRLEAEGAQPGV